MGIIQALRQLFSRAELAEREAQVVSNAIFEQWEADTWCGAFPDRESRDAWIARKQGRAA